jgi:hypothetical protein
MTADPRDLRGLHSYVAYLSVRTGLQLTTEQVIEYLLLRKNVLDDRELTFTVVNGHITHWPLDGAGELAPEGASDLLFAERALEYAANLLRTSDPDGLVDDNSCRWAAMRLDRAREQAQR